jgi:hypothetical protein
MTDIMRITLEHVRTDGAIADSLSLLVNQNDFETEEPEELGGVLQIVDRHKQDPLARASLRNYASVMAKRFTDASGNLRGPEQIVQIDGRPLRMK